MPDITEKVTVTSVDRVRISSFMAELREPVVYGVRVTVKGETVTAEFTVPMAESVNFPIGMELSATFTKDAP